MLIMLGYTAVCVPFRPHEAGAQRLGVVTTIDGRAVRFLAVDVARPGPGFPVGLPLPCATCSVRTTWRRFDDNTPLCRDCLDAALLEGK